jgi:hypothetical protein
MIFLISSGKLRKAFKRCLLLSASYYTKIVWHGCIFLPASSQNQVRLAQLRFTVKAACAPFKPAQKALRSFHTMN